MRLNTKPLNNSYKPKSIAQLRSSYSRDVAAGSAVLASSNSVQHLTFVFFVNMILYSLSLTISLLLLWVSRTVSVQCYNPNGTPVNPDYQPCHSGQQSMCCASNRTGTGINVCRPDNLCDDADISTVWRQSCTDPTWKDPSCIQLCNNGFAAGLVRENPTGCLPYTFANITRRMAATSICMPGIYLLPFAQTEAFAVEKLTILAAVAKEDTGLSMAKFTLMKIFRPPRQLLYPLALHLHVLLRQHPRHPLSLSHHHRPETG